MKYRCFLHVFFFLSQIITFSHHSLTYKYVKINANCKFHLYSSCCAKIWTWGRTRHDCCGFLKLTHIYVCMLLLSHSNIFSHIITFCSHPFIIHLVKECMYLSKISGCGNGRSLVETEGSKYTALQLDEKLTDFMSSSTCFDKMMQKAGTLVANCSDLSPCRPHGSANTWTNYRTASVFVISESKRLSKLEHQTLVKMRKHQWSKYNI